ncbi:MAG: DUF3237 domain-containing protein [Gammaproteobacteria bacterium]|nr:DUF3237 domain-containing protein [Gammaproteobacteria bacterium]
MRTTVTRALMLLTTLFALPAAQAADSWNPAALTAPQAVPVLQITASITPAIEVGTSDAGTRRYIPITGGTFVGNGIRGEVVPGGADWQLTRSDGATELTAIYALRTDDGANIIVNNHGLGVPPAEAGGARYLMSSPKFFAPADGPYAWLNQSIFVGTVTPAPDMSAVIIRVFKVQ